MTVGPSTAVHRYPHAYPRCCGTFVHCLRTRLIHNAHHLSTELSTSGVYVEGAFGGGDGGPSYAQQMPLVHSFWAFIHVGSGMRRPQHTVLIWSGHGVGPPSFQGLSVMWVLNIGVDKLEENLPNPLTPFPKREGGTEDGGTEEVAAVNCRRTDTGMNA